MTASAKPDGWYPRWGKRLFDVLVSASVIVLLSPLYAILGLAAFLVHGAPILFRQRRPGRDGRPFVLIKFRTMRRLQAQEPDEDAVRLTRFGRFLRRTSLDELPELWCILRGDMSLVGPRPLLMEYLPLYTPRQSRRHEVRPGLTGWAQIHGRNEISWEEKFERDLWYVEHCSLRLDLKILWESIGKVLRGEGISAPEHATMPRFKGSRK